MSKIDHKDKVIRIQGDRLCQFLGYPTGTKIDIGIIKAIASANAGDMLVIDGKSVNISMSAIGNATVLLKKIEG